MDFIDKTKKFFYNVWFYKVIKENANILSKFYLTLFNKEIKNNNIKRKEYDGNKDKINKKFKNI